MDSLLQPAELAGEAAHCFRDLGRSAETLLFADNAIEPTDTPARTRAFGMVSANGGFNGGNLDEAIVMATQAVDLAGPLQSSRYLRYVADFQRAISTAHARDARVRAFTTRVPGAHSSRAGSLKELIIRHACDRLVGIRRCGTAGA